MTSLRVLGLALLIGLSTSVVSAQPVVGEGAGPGPMGMGAAASAPGMGMAMGPGGPRGTARWGSEFTPGWAMMTQPERDEHRERMRSMKTYEECKSYQTQHHGRMVARAKERGGKALSQALRDACGSLKQ